MTLVTSSEMSLNYLFIDTTHNLSLGLLNEEFSWLSYFRLEEKKSATLIHSKIWKILEQNNLKIKDLAGVIYIAGPGSYTGMRVSDGIAKLLQWQNIPIYSFYHFQVPKVLGEKNGYWVSSAHKNQFFVYRWNQDQSEYELLDTLDNIESRFSNDESFYSDEFKNTAHLIKENPQSIFKWAVENKVKEELFYYRKLSDEFKLKEKKSKNE